MKENRARLLVRAGLGSGVKGVVRDQVHRLSNETVLETSSAWIGVEFINDVVSEVVGRREADWFWERYHFELGLSLQDACLYYDM